MSDSPKRGGESDKRPSHRSIPRGIEVLVKKASVDAAFCELLLDKRALAASEIGLELSPAEIATLNSVPRSQIEQIIRNTKVPDEHRRVFLGKIAAAMLALLGFGLSSCSTEDLEEHKYRRRAPGGISPRDHPPVGGIRPAGAGPDDPPGHRSPSDSKTSAPEGKDFSGSDAEKDRSKGSALDKESSK
jgi:hypothetical protein